MPSTPQLHSSSPTPNLDWTPGEHWNCSLAKPTCTMKRKSKRSKVSGSSHSMLRPNLGQTAALNQLHLEENTACGLRQDANATL